MAPGGGALLYDEGLVVSAPGGGALLVRIVRALGEPAGPSGALTARTQAVLSTRGLVVVAARIKGEIGGEVAGRRREEGCGGPMAGVCGLRVIRERMKVGGAGREVRAPLVAMGSGSRGSKGRRPAMVRGRPAMMRG
jgi:hypothetical protein